MDEDYIKLLIIMQTLLMGLSMVLQQVIIEAVRCLEELQHQLPQQRNRLQV